MSIKTSAVTSNVIPFPTERCRQHNGELPLDPLARFHALGEKLAALLPERSAAPSEPLSEAEAIRQSISDDGDKWQRNEILRLAELGYSRAALEELDPLEIIELSAREDAKQLRGARSLLTASPANDANAPLLNVDR